jgi:hypothetical protein
MKNIFFLSFYLLRGSLITDNSEGLAINPPDFINPTGTYILKGEVKNSKIIGPYGELRVRLLDTGTIALCFSVNKGYPNYESGSLVDTLRYEDNRSIYRPANDSSCTIYFTFELRAAEVSDVVTDPHSGCGFRPGVMAPAVLEKTSSEIPVIQDLSLHGSF